MKRVAVIFADGFEEIEAVSVVDILRRGGVEVVMVGLDKNAITGAHGIKISTDCTLYDFKSDDFDMIVLPGGSVGVANIGANLKMREIIKQFDKQSKQIAAICAAAIALGMAEILKGKFTCYPGCETAVQGGEYTNDQNVVTDGNITTSAGPATAMEFGLSLLRLLVGDEMYKKVKDELLFVK